MELNLVGIPLLFALLAALILWLVILGQGQWWLKMILVSVALFFSVAVWSSLSNLSGWPATKPLPAKFSVHWILIEEPSALDRTKKGNIFVWATELDQDLFPKEKNELSLAVFAARHAIEPRVYRVPYSSQMHQSSLKAMGLLRKGKPVVGQKGKMNSDADGTGDAETESKKKGKGRSHGGFTPDQDFIFYELPPAKLPPKDPQNVH